MSLFGSITDSVKSAFHKAEVAVGIEKAPPPPAAAAPAAPAVPAQYKDGMDRPAASPVNLSGGRGEVVGGEAQVAARADRNKPMNLFGTSQTERVANMKRLTQIDGSSATATDQTTCGVQCVVAGLYLKNPTALPAVAAFELKKNAKDLDGLANNLGMTEQQLKTDLEAIKAGTASPRQISVLSQVLMNDVKTRNPGDRKAGTDSGQLQTLTKDILKNDCNVEPPQMRLELRQRAGSGHWESEFDVASMQDTEEGAKKDHVISFDPWPNAKGYSPTAIALDASQAKGQHGGSMREEHYVGSDGSIS